MRVVGEGREGRGMRWSEGGEGMELELELGKGEGVGSGWGWLDGREELSRLRKGSAR